MRKLLSIVALALLLSGCSKVPDGIIPPEEMAQLMADVHTGEAVIEMNRSDYPGDSLKQVFKQSVYERHGVDVATVDSSFLWYGRHIDKYMDVYDRTIEILERRLIESGNRVTAEAAMSMAGDSVDVWPYARFMTINSRMPSRTIVFDASNDENWQKGDMYIWRAKFIGNARGSRSRLVTEYSNGTIDFINHDIEGNGWQEVVMYTDSTLEASRIYGFITASNQPGTSLRIDSIELVRKRVDPELYSRRYTIRRLPKAIPQK